MKRRFTTAMLGVFALMLTVLGFVPSTAGAATTITVQGGMKYGNLNPADPSDNPYGIEDFCTMGAVGYDAAGNKVGITVGHCGKVGWKALTATGGHELGTVVTSRVDYLLGASFEWDKYDYGFILFNENVVFADDSDTVVNPTSIGAPASWQRVCKFGHAPLQLGEKCGTSVGLRPIEFDITAASFFGDSGGPVYRPSAPNVLLGMISRPAMPGLTTVQRADAASADALAKGWIGGGFQPVA